MIFIWPLMASELDELIVTVCVRFDCNDSLAIVCVGMIE